MLAEDIGISVSEMSKHLKVSEVTIRSDLKSLENRGYLLRTGGRVMPTLHQNVFERLKTQINEKNRIAKAAAALVEDGDTIMIEAGTTTALVAKYLLGKRDVHVVTTSTLIIPYARINPGLHLTMTGGEFRPLTESFVGPIALTHLEQFHVRLAFVGTDGFTMEKGLTTHLIEGAEIVRKMAGQSDKTILVADSRKYGKTGFMKVLPIDRVTLIITDDQLEDEQVEDIEAKGVRVQLT
jgi:DeoR family galactitol utilization operon repressor